MGTREEAPIFLAPDEVMDHLVGICADHGSVEAVRLFCRADRCTEVFGMVEMAKPITASRAGAALGAFVVGAEVCAYLDIPPDFRCPYRSGGRMTTGSCSRCRRLGLNTAAADVVAADRRD